MDSIKLYGTTSSGGALTVQSDSNVKGKLEYVEWIDGDLADGVDAVLSCVRNDNAADLTLLTLTDANNDQVYIPRGVVHSVAGVAQTLTPGDGRLLVNGQLKLVVSSGGNAKTGGCIVYVCDD